MKHFLLPENFIFRESQVQLDEKETHYLKNVLRLKKGDVFNAVDRKGGNWKAEIKTLNKGRAVIFVRDCPGLSEALTGTYENRELAEIVLYQAIIKGSRMDLVIRQAAEAGVSKIVPVITEFSVAKIEERNKSARIERWKRIIREALQQSGSIIPTEITEPVLLKDIAVPGIETFSLKRETSLFFHQKSIENKSLHQYLFPDTKRVNILTGPEGGLSENDLQWLMDNNFKPVYLGRNILRAETAAIYAAAAVKIILLEKKTWKIA